MPNANGSSPLVGRTWLGAVVLVFATLLVYAPALRGGFVWDDDDYVLNNRALTEPGGLARIWTDPQASPQFYPLTLTTFWLERRLWGLRPLGYHVVNALLHAANALLLWRVLARLAVPGAWLAAAIFALHPLEVESVAWVTERKNTLSAALYLLATLSWLRFDAASPARPGRAGAAPSRAWAFYAASLLCYGLALLSKTVTATLPAALLLLLWWKRGLTRRDLLLTAPMFALGAAAGALTSWLERTQVGAAGPDWAFSFAERVLIAGRALWFYAAKLVWPHPLMFVYPRWRVDVGSVAQWLFPLAAAAVLAALWLARRRIGRGPAAAAFFFAGTLLPALGFVNVYPMRFSFVADHFQYLAGTGLIALAAALATRAVGGRAGARAALAAAVLLPLCWASWSRGVVYRDVEALWRDTLAQNPGAWVAHLNLGTILRGQGDDAAAAERFAQCVRLKPDFEMGWYNWGTALAALGDPAGAERAFREALRLSPDYADAWSNLGIVLHRQRRAAEALSALSEARRLKPGGHLVHYNLGVVYKAQGMTQEAAASFRRALELWPGFAPAASELAGLSVPR